MIYFNVSRKKYLLYNLDQAMSINMNRTQRLLLMAGLGILMGLLTTLVVFRLMPKLYPELNKTSTQPTATSPGNENITDQLNP